MTATPSPIRWESLACDLCQSTQSHVELSGIDWELGLAQSPTLVKCDGCGLVYLNPRPDLESIHLIYPPEYGYYSPAKAAAGGALRAVARRLRQLLRPSPPARQYPYIKANERGRILDVGCAMGGSVYPYGASGSLVALSAAGWECHGLEYDQRAAEIARSMGIDVRAGRLGDADFGGKQFDVIRFNHVLEHSVSPSADLRTAAQLLTPAGRLIVSGPNIDSAAYRLFGKYWSGLDLPRHFYHFTPTTLSAYFSKAGLAVKAQFFDGCADDWVHSLKHFLHSNAAGGEDEPCSRRDAIGTIFGAAAWPALQSTMTLLSAHFNQNAMSDSFTLIGTPATQPRLDTNIGR